MKLESKVAIITGGSSGIGLATAFLLLSKGAKVMIADINDNGGEIYKQYPTNIGFEKTDVTSEESINNLIKKTIELFGKIDILINSAGIVWGELTATFKTTHSTENFTRVYKINTIGTFNMCKHVAKHIAMTPNPNNEERAVFINISSIIGIEGSMGLIAYAASKGAIIGMTLPMARDLGKYGIRVNCIAPSLIETPMMKSIDMKKKKIIRRSNCFGKIRNYE